MIDLTHDPDLDLALAVAALRLAARRLDVRLVILVDPAREAVRVHVPIPVTRESERQAIYAELRRAVGEAASNAVPFSAEVAAAAKGISEV